MHFTREKLSKTRMLSSFNNKPTCVANCIMEEQNPAAHAVAYIISTEEANMVRAHDIANGIDM